MEVQLVTVARVDRGDHDRLSIDDEAHMADERLVEYPVHDLGVVATALWQTLDLGPRAGGTGHRQPHQGQSIALAIE